ncbi:MAG TPA: hypothetical protein VHI71_10615 [Actinomycetota bacterium]|nr:hypothetical protein [Actinomycetota bacterium]
MRRRLSVLLLSSALATVGLVGLSASPASASCIETGIPEVGCVNPCPPGPWVCTQ